MKTTTLNNVAEIEAAVNAGGYINAGGGYTEGGTGLVAQGGSGSFPEGSRRPGKKKRDQRTGNAGTVA